jgi:hypothetical protein
MSIHSWLLFTLIACSLAISEEMTLKVHSSLMHIFLNIVSLSSPYKFKHQRNFKFSFSQGNIILCGLYQYFFDNHLFKVAQNPLQKSDLLSKFQFCKSDYLILDTEHVRPLHWVPVRFLDLSGLLSKFSVSSKIFIFCLSLPSILIYVIM